MAQDRVLSFVHIFTRSMQSFTILSTKMKGENWNLVSWVKGSYYRSRCRLSNYLTSRYSLGLFAWEMKFFRGGTKIVGRKRVSLPGEKLYFSGKFLVWLLLFGIYHIYIYIIHTFYVSPGYTWLNTARGKVTTQFLLLS